MNEKERKPVRAPYNFIPFHTKGRSGTPGAVEKTRMEKVLIRYPDIAELPRHDVIDPELKTGEIHVTMRAETPVFVSDGHKKKEIGKDGTITYKDDPHFFKGANGKFMLPGSTIRGMVGESMRILGYGLVRPGEDLEDYQIYFREMSAATGSAGDALKQYYRGVLGICSEQRGGKSVSVPGNVKSGYLRREGDRFYIRPAKSPCIRVPQSSAALEEAGLVEGEAETKDVVYTLDGKRVTSIAAGADPAPGEERGVLLYTGKGIGRREDPRSKNARYLFPAADEEADPVWITEEDLLSYQEDFENRKNILGEKQDFWALPQNGKEKPVFYIRHNGHVYFGMSLFLRIGYSHRLSDGLPGRREERGTENTPLDYAHAILGFAEKDRSYRSRVSFGDFAALGDPREGVAIKTILGQPKPSWYPGYVTDGRNYNEAEFYLRGYKLYWLKDAWAPPVPDGKEKVGSTLRPLPEGTVFRGVIRYKNLHPDELGLLLWALRLDDGCFQSIGMGKPYGFGRMKLTIDSLREYDAAALYAPDNLCRIPASGDQNSIERYIKLYDSYACEALHIKKTSKKAPCIRSEGPIQDFLYMRSTIRDRDEAGYMELPEYKNMAGILPTAQEIRESAEQARRKAEEEAPKDVNDLLAMWMEQINRNKN